MASWRGHFLESFELDEQASRFREIGKRCLWRAQNPDLHSRETDSLIKEAIHAFLGLFFVQRRYLKEAIQTLLCLLGHSDKHIQSKALEGLFKLVVERLNDSFNPNMAHSITTSLQNSSTSAVKNATAPHSMKN